MLVCEGRLEVLFDLPQAFPVSFNGTPLEKEFQYCINNSTSDQAASEVE